MDRKITSIRSGDIVVFAGGRSGTLGELAIAYNEGRLLGVLTATGGITGMVEDPPGLQQGHRGVCAVRRRPFPADRPADQVLPDQPSPEAILLLRWPSGGVPMAAVEFQ